MTKLNLFVNRKNKHSKPENLAPDSMWSLVGPEWKRMRNIPGHGEAEQR